MTQQPALNGKVILITGATNGIGKEAARQLAQTGATIVIAGRNPQKVTDVISEIKAETRNPNTDGIVADLSRIAGMRSLSQQFKQKYDRLDVLLNNAGAMFTERHLTEDGFEQTFALNHLSYFLVTNDLLDLLKASAPARIVNVASAVHTGGKMAFDDLHAESGYNPLGAYSQSKLANIMFTYELDKRLEGAGVTVNALHPGVVRSSFGRSNPGIIGRVTGIVLGLMQQFRGVDVGEGADTAVYLAASPEVEGISGSYWYKRQQTPSSPDSLDERSWQRLWTVSEAMIRA
jgi:NAD(P)-dependent dehydrogenase (short-subunit alcohol dehydrogenase family)